MDEVSIVGETQVVEVTPDGIRSYTVAPEQVGLERADPESIARRRRRSENAEIARERARRRARPAARARRDQRRRRAVRRRQGAPSLEEGVRLAEQTIDSGAAREALDRFVAKTGELAPEREHGS